MIMATGVPGVEFKAFPDGKSQTASLHDNRTKEKEKFQEQFESRRNSIRVHYLTLFLNAFVTTIIYSSLWPYLKLMDVETTTWYLGFVHAAFNVAELCCIILFGAWVQFRPGHEPLIFSLVCLIIGNALYSWSLSFGYYGKFVVLVARLFVGCSTGNDVVVTALICNQTTLKERTTVIAYCSLAQSVGFTIGPAIQAVFVPIGSRGVFFEFLYLHINMYTAAGLLAALFGVGNLVAVWFKGRTEYNIDNPYIDTASDEASSEGNDDSTSLLKKSKKKDDFKRLKTLPENMPDIVAVLITLVIFFIARFVLVFVEVMFAPMAMDMYALTDEDTVLYVGIILAATGILSSITFIATEKIASWIGDRIPVIVSMLFLFIAFLILWPVSSRYPKLGHFYTETVNTTTGVELVKKVTPGCSPTHVWCNSTPIITFAQFLVSLTIVTLAFPVSYAILPSLFTKIIPPGKQGILVSLFSISGNLSRIIGPAAFTSLYAWYGPKLLFGLMDFGLGFAFILSIVFYKRLIPYKNYLRKMKKKQSIEKYNSFK